MLYLLLYPFSIIYGIITSVRNKLYDWRVLRSTSFNFPIISIGNLTVGGVGKTPHTEYLIRLLKLSYNISTLSRGYKRKTKGFILANENSTLNDIGDEPLQYHKKFKNIHVAVDEKRVRGIEKLKLKFKKLEVVLLDDAFQHRSIKPSLNILITQYNKLFCDDFMLPSGRLREFSFGSKRADLIVVSKCNNNISIKEKEDIRKRLKLLSHQKLFFSFIKYGIITPFTSKASTIQLLDKENFSSLLITGIANPKPLYNNLLATYKSVDQLNFPDHHQFTANDINTIKTHFGKIVNNNKIIITTEKDIMRLSLPTILSEIEDLPFFYIPIEIDFLDNDKKIFDNEILNHVRNY